MTPSRSRGEKKTRRVEDRAFAIDIYVSDVTRAHFRLTYIYSLHTPSIDLTVRIREETCGRGLEVGTGGIEPPYTFDFNGTTLRTIEIDGAPWFVAADACRCLGLEIKAGGSGARNYLQRLRPNERRVVRKTVVACSPLFADSKAPSLTLITESGLYKLVMRSDKAEAIAFQDWVTDEVLPAIRKTGGYLLNEAARENAHADTKDAMPLPPP